MLVFLCLQSCNTPFDIKMLVFAARNLVNQRTEEDHRKSIVEIHRTVCSPDSLYSKLGDLASGDFYLALYKMASGFRSCQY